jgi:hypothetical protein
MINPAHNYYFRAALNRLQAYLPGISHKIGNILNLGWLTIVRKNSSLSFVLQIVNLFFEARIPSVQIRILHKPSSLNGALELEFYYIITSLRIAS